MMREKWHEASADIIEWLYPARCPVCDGAAYHGTKICPECYPRLHPVGSTYCLRCGKPVRSEEVEYCEDCEGGAHEYLMGRAVFLYDEALRQSVYRMKYGKRREYADFYGEQMVKHLGRFINSVGADALIPVPVSEKRLKERGYNQAGLLAERISGLTGIPVVSNLVVRVRDTTPQKQLDAAERQNNLKKAFKIVQNDVKLKVTIIIDDIYTTGATIDAVARVLKESGVGRVYFAALAIGRA